MLNFDNAYRDDIYARMMHTNTFEEDYIEASHLHQFCKKQTKLAWTFVNIISEVHMNNNFNNDLSFDNILLHFLEDKLRIYIGIYDWDMTTKASEPMKSLYTFISKQQMTKALR